LHEERAHRHVIDHVDRPPWIDPPDRLLDDGAAIVERGTVLPPEQRKRRRRCLAANGPDR